VSTPAHLELARRAVHLFVRPSARRVLITLSGAVSVAIAAAAEPLLFKTIIDHLARVSTGDRPPGAAYPIAALIAAFALVLAFRLIGAAWVTTSTWRVRLDIEYQLRERVAAKMSVIAPRTQTEIGTGGLRYAIDAGAPQTATAITDVAFRIPQILIYVGLAAWGMMRLDHTIATIVLALVPLPATVAVLRASRQITRDAMLQRFWTRLWAWYTEVLHGMATVRAFANERLEERRFTRRMRWAFAAIQRGVDIDAGATAATGIAELLARLTVLSYGGYLVMHGRLTVGALLALLGFAGGVFTPLQQLVDLYPSIRKAAVALQAVFRVLDADEEVPDPPGASAAPRLRGDIRFEDVSFSYGHGRPAIDHLHLTVRPGETVALVGPSGGGKTTILHLLQRVHLPSAGRILLDGHDLRALQIATVRRQLGVVPQDIVLFNDTVAANIAYGRPNATRLEIEAAARAANAHEFIARLPRGYETVIGESGRALSGGQRQRLALARAFLVDPAILLLDEATAALDAESEHAVQDALRTLCRGRTTLIVAHRLATVREADRIVVVAGGRVVGEGRHETLLASCPLYASLVRLQLGAEPPGPPPEGTQGIALVA
jgi:ATP-binding cassette subfamily B protein